MTKVAILIFTVFFTLFSYAQDCTNCAPKQTEATLPTAPKFDHNFMGCYNYYAVDLGQASANKKCETLSKIQNFSEPSFATCNNYLQPSRSEWRAAVADRCLELAKIVNFSTKSFGSCVEHLSIAESGATKEARKIKSDTATEKCIAIDSTNDFTSKSFVSCFYVYGGVKRPLKDSDANDSIEIAMDCSTKSKRYNFKDEKFYNCWEAGRKNTTNEKMKEMVDECLKKSF